MLRVIENSGASMEEAIVIEADSHVIGVMEEYAYFDITSFFSTYP